MDDAAKRHLANFYIFGYKLISGIAYGAAGSYIYNALHASQPVTLVEGIETGVSAGALLGITHAIMNYVSTNNNPVMHMYLKEYHPMMIGIFILVTAIEAGIGGLLAALLSNNFIDHDALQIGRAIATGIASVETATIVPKLLLFGCCCRKQMEFLNPPESNQGYTLAPQG